MKVKITASAQPQFGQEERCKVVHHHDIKEEGELSKAVKVVIDDFRKQCGSIYGMTIKVEH